MPRPTPLCLLVATLWCAAPSHAQEPPPTPTAGPEARERHSRRTARFLAERQELVDRDRDLRASGRQVLTSQEAKAAAYLDAVRSQEVGQFKRTNAFPPARSFLGQRAAIESSRTFRILRRMPKGGALHVHSSAAGRARWLVETASYRSDCYIFWPDGDAPAARGSRGKLGFFRPGAQRPGYKPAAEVRAAVSDLDRRLAATFSLTPEDESSPDVWPAFAARFDFLGAALSSQEVFDGYFLDAFEALAEDGVDYVELRTGIGLAFDPDGQTWTPAQYVDRYRILRDRVRQRHPDFDVKLILAYSRFDGVSQERPHLLQAFTLRSHFPDLVVGFDLVGQEDTAPVARAFLPLFERLPGLAARFRVELPLFFHAGESVWTDDENLYDAILMGSRRIGHGLNLHLFPALERCAIRDDIAFEVCPISNQVLRYVGDLRVHPASGFLRRGVPCVLSSDDPAIFGSAGLSHDFWEAFMAWGLDLADLKQLALNSIRYSARTLAEKRAARARWETRWVAFIRDLVAEADRAGRP